MKIQRWWRRFKNKAVPMLISEKIVEEKKYKNDLIIDLQEEEFDDTELSSVDDFDDSIPSGSPMTDPLLDILNGDDDNYKVKEFVHTNKKFQDKDLEKILQGEYNLSEYRLYKNSMEEYQKNYSGWSFYPVVNEYAGHTNIQYNHFSYSWNPVIVPYLDHTKKFN